MQSQLASEHGIYPLQITAWKKQVAEVLREVFGTRRERTAVEPAEGSRWRRSAWCGRICCDSPLGRASRVAPADRLPHPPNSGAGPTD